MKCTCTLNDKNHKKIHLSFVCLSEVRLHWQQAKHDIPDVSLPSKTRLISVHMGLALPGMLCDLAVLCGTFAQDK